MRSDAAKAAPRELVDYLERAARLAGADPGLGAVFARHLTDAEIDLGDAIVVALDELDRPDPLARFQQAVEAVEAGELALAAVDRTVVSFPEPMPAALLWGALLAARRRGAVRTQVAVAETGRDELSSIELFRDEPRPAPYRRWAHADGVPVPAPIFDALVARAKPILVAESVLDAADA